MPASAIPPSSPWRGGAASPSWWRATARIRPKALDAWAARAQAWAAGAVPTDLERVAGGKAAAGKARDVFLYVISGHKERNPAAAEALIKRLG